jgi:hypothetical protein
MNKYLEKEPCCFKNIIEFLLEGRWFSEGPIRILLMAKYDIFKYRFRYPEQVRDLSVHFGTFCRDRAPLQEVNGRETYMQTDTLSPHCPNFHLLATRYFQGSSLSILRSS